MQTAILFHISSFLLGFFDGVELLFEFCISVVLCDCISFQIFFIDCFKVIDSWHKTFFKQKTVFTKPLVRNGCCLCLLEDTNQIRAVNQPCLIEMRKANNEKPIPPSFATFLNVRSDAHESGISESLICSGSPWLQNQCNGLYRYHCNRLLKEFGSKPRQS